MKGLVLGVSILVAIAAGAKQPSAQEKSAALVEKRLSAVIGADFVVLKTVMGPQGYFQAWVAAAKVKSTPGGPSSEQESALRGVTIDYWEGANALEFAENWRHAVNTSVGAGEAIKGPWKEGRIWRKYNGGRRSRVTFAYGRRIVSVAGPDPMILNLAEEVFRATMNVK